MLTFSRKVNTNSIIGTAGARTILDHLSAMTDLPHRTATVAIGGINASNVQRVIYQSKSMFRGLDGVAVVSAIIAADKPRHAAHELIRLMGTPPPFAASAIARCGNVPEMLRKVLGVVKEVRSTEPLCHNMTNLVVQNFAANVALAMYGSPTVLYGAMLTGSTAVLVPA